MLRGPTQATGKSSQLTALELGAIGFMVTGSPNHFPATVHHGGGVDPGYADANGGSPGTVQQRFCVDGYVGWQRTRVSFGTAAATPASPERQPAWRKAPVAICLDIQSGYIGPKACGTPACGNLAGAAEFSNYLCLCR